MKLFINSFLNFSLIFLTIIFLIISLNKLIIKFTPINFSSDKNILLIGDSNSETAVNDSVFKRVVNFSSPAESYFYSYLKLNKILANNNNLDTVLLSFSPHNIFDNKWFENRNFVRHHFCRYYTIMNYSDFILVTKHHFKTIIHNFNSIILQFIKNIYRKYKGEDILKLGGFTALKTEMLEESIRSLEKKNQIINFRLPTKLDPTPIETIYLNKIYQLCDKKQVKLILINFPKRQELLNHKNYGIKEFHKFYEKNFQHINYFDFSCFSMTDNMYSDFFHLHERGALYFSKFLEKNKWEKFRY